MKLGTVVILSGVVLLLIANQSGFAGIPGDFDGDTDVDFNDFAVLASAWRTTPLEPLWNPACDISEPNDDIINEQDLAVLTANWLPWLACDPNMRLVSGGTFQMGDSFSEGYSDELPVHTVSLDSFYMSRYEITNWQYCEYLNSAYQQGLITVISGSVYKAGSGTSYPYCDISIGGPFNYSQIAYSNGVFAVRTKDGRDMSNDPMVCVSWYGAAAYCNWRSQQEGREQCYNLSTWNCDFSKHGYRLATEAEWEYAARGSLSARRFPWGDTISQIQANFRSSSSYAYDVSPVKNIYHPIWGVGSYPYTSPVGFFDGGLKYKAEFNWPGSDTSYQTTNGANNYGLYDVAGNVFEWCNDWYSSTYYSSSPTNNPTGPVSGTYRVLRGGYWYGYAAHCRVAYRNDFVNGNPSYRSTGRGFRVVLLD